MRTHDSNSAFIPVSADDWGEMVRASRRDKEQREYLTMILETIEGGGRIVTFLEQDIQTLRDLLKNDQDNPMKDNPMKDNPMKDNPINIPPLDVDQKVQVTLSLGALMTLAQVFYHTAPQDVAQLVGEEKRTFDKCAELCALRDHLGDLGVNLPTRPGYLTYEDY